MFAYGFEDLTGAVVPYVQALAGPHGRVRLAPVRARAPRLRLARRGPQPTWGASGRAGGGAAARVRGIAHPALAHLERSLFSRVRGSIRRRSRARALPRAAGSRGHWSSSPTRFCGSCATHGAGGVAIVCPSLDRLRAPLGRRSRRPASPAPSRTCAPRPDPVRPTHSSPPFGSCGRARGDATSSAFLRFAVLGPARAHADYLEGPLRGNGVRHDIEERTVRLRGQPLPQLDDVRAAPSPKEAARVLATGMLRAAHGLESPPRASPPRRPACPRAGPAPAAGARGLARPRGSGQPRGRARRARARDGSTGGAAEPGRVAVIDLLRAATRRFEAVFVLGLEEGSLTRRRRSRRSSTTSTARPRRGGRARDSSAPTPSHASGSSSTPRAPARPVA